MSQVTPMTEPPPITRFHEIHGNDIQLFNNRTTAERLKSTSKSGLVFSSHPLNPNETFSIKLSEIFEKTEEIINVGFAVELSQNLEPNRGVKICTRRKNYSIKNRVFYFYYTLDGTLHFGIDGTEKGRFWRYYGRLPAGTTLWAFIRLSTPTTVEVVNSRAYDSSSTINLGLKMLHESRGRNVKLSQNRAHKFDKTLNTSYVFTSRPVSIGEHVIVKILDVDTKGRGGLTFGLTTCNPSHLPRDNLPDTIHSLFTRNEYWVSIGDPSWNFKQYDKISFVLSYSGEMKIWRNDSTLLKLVKVEKYLKMWAFFDIANVESIAVTSYMTPGVHLWSEVRNNTLVNCETGGDTDDDNNCIVCCETVIEAALYPCGHMCMCTECAKEQWRGAGHGRCPICRMTIKDVLKIYKK